MSVIAKAEITISDILDGNSISEITNFYKVSSKSSGETAPQTSGGRNLVWNSNFSNGSKYWTPNAAIISIVHDDMYESTLRVVQNEATYPESRIYQANLINYGKLYTLSFYAKADTAIELNQGIAGSSNLGSFNLTTSWQKFTRTFNSGLSGSLTFYASGTTPYQIAKIKLEYGNVATDWTPAPEDLGWSTTVPTLTETNKYLWNYEMITGSDGQVISYTEPRVIGVYGDKGQTGSTGATGPTGNGIKSITEYYQISTSNTTAPTTWLTTVPTLTATNKYLWNYEKITYTNGTSVDTAKRVIGVYGDKGQTGATGPAGKGIKSTAITYQASTSGTTAPTGTWNTSVPSVPQGQYLWSRTVITYTDNSTSTTYSVAYIPKNGATGGTGPTGPTGTGISNITQQYYLSTSKTTQTGGSWVTSMPTWSSGKYLWTRYKIDYKNPASTSYTTPVCDSSWEAVNEIQVGGRNYIKGGKGTDDSGLFKNFNTIDTENGYAEHTLTSKKQHASVNIAPGFVLDCRDYEVGKQMVFSYDIMYTKWDFPEGTNRQEFWIGQRYTNQSKTDGDKTGQWKKVTAHTPPIVGSNGCVLNKWYHVEKLITIPSQAAEGIGTAGSFQFYNSNADVAATVTFRLKNIKLEYGNKATDWTPAPEDVEQGIQDAQSSADKAQGTADSVGNRVTVAESQIKQVKDSISMMVTDENGSSLMTQTSDGWTFNIGGIQNTLDDARDKLGELTGSVSGLNDTTKKLDSLITDITKKTAYINMATDSSGNPCIELGKIGDPFKVRITNTSVDFIEGSSRIAYISNNALYIEKAIIKNELQIGDGSGFIWRKRSNGNMGLRRT